MIIPPYPFTLEDPPNVPLEDTWYARPHLFFSCWFRPTGGRPPSQGNYTIGPDDFQMELVFFSTFEELQLPARGPMDHATTKLYEPSPTPPDTVRGPPQQCSGESAPFPPVPGRQRHSHDTTPSAPSQSQRFSAWRS